VGTTSSGCSQIGGSDLVVSLGSFATTLVGGVLHARGTSDQQAGTLMHELGHNLGFRHGGGDNVNCKPNYLSVMSYSRQFSNLITGRRLDYSHDQLPTLDEVGGMMEANGIGLPGIFPPGLPNFQANEQTVFGGASGLATVMPIPPGGTGIDWDLDPKDQVVVSFSTINNLPVVGCTQPAGTQLVGFADWSNVHYNHLASLESAGGADPEQTETTAEQEAAGFASVDSDGNGIADALQCSNDPNLVGKPGPGAACLIDVKPGDPLNISNLVAPLQGVLPVALLGSATFDPTTMVDRSTLTLNGNHVQLKPNGQFNCSTGDVSGPAGVPDGFKDLQCKFDGVSFQSEGSFYVTLEGNLLPGFPPDPNAPVGGRIRARDVVNVCRTTCP
jgi:hypothetical protein